MWSDDFKLTLTGGFATLKSSNPSSIEASGDGKEYQLGIDLVGIPNGNEVLTISPVDNNIFDASKLFVSSEGTLGIVLEIKFRIVDIPKYKNLALIQFDDLTKAGKAVIHILKIGPSALEIIDAKILKMAQSSHPELKRFPKNLQAVLLVEFDHSQKDGIDKKMQSLKLKFQKINNLAIDLETFSDPINMKKIWSLRKKCDVSKSLVIKNSKSGDIYPYKTAKHKFPRKIDKCSIPLNTLTSIRDTNDEDKKGPELL